MLEEFIKYYSKLPRNLMVIIETTIRMMKKEHQVKESKKRLDVPGIINYYRKKEGLTVEQLIDKCNGTKFEDVYSINTYKAIIKRNVVVKLNLMMKMEQDFFVKY